MSFGVENVSVSFGATKALRGVTVDVEPGTVTAVVGGDGAGKTTLARTLVGLEPVDEGRVHRPDRVGFQPESSGVWGDLSVYENLALVAGAYGFTPQETESRIDELLDVTALASTRDRLGRELSGGMRQKLGVAMALLATPDLLVLDEPTTGLDPVSRLELWAFIARAASEGRAVLTTTAYVEEAERAAQVFVLDEGQVLASGSVADVLAAVPGSLFTVDHRGEPLSWRRGRSWRVWSPTGHAPANSQPVEADLQDAVTVAALARESAR